jgi:hypothetical protein
MSTATNTGRKQSTVITASDWGLNVMYTVQRSTFVHRHPREKYSAFGRVNRKMTVYAVRSPFVIANAVKQSMRVHWIASLRSQ